MQPLGDVAHVLAALQELAEVLEVLQGALANVQQMQADLIAQVNAVTAISPPATEPKPGWVVAPA